MSALRVTALGIGWIVLLAGSLACIAAGVFAVADVAGATFGPDLAGTLLVTAVGFGLMIGAMPMMFFGCEAHRPGRATGFALAPQQVPTVSIPVAPVHVHAGSMAMSGNRLSSFAVLTLEHRL